MNEQNEDQNLDIQNGVAMRDLLSSHAWKLIEEQLEVKADIVRMKRDISDDPSVVMACVRQEDGIMFVKEVIQDFIHRGDEASKMLDQ